MIVIADSGSTKTDWVFVENGEIINRVTSNGINPCLQTKDEIVTEIKSVFERFHYKDEISSFFFYGAGCTHQKKEIIRDVLSSFSFNAEIEVESDMLGAARALFGRDKGIASILGTGSNSCYYNGEFIEKNISPLGFILGDEGSGAVIGKFFIGNLLKNQFEDDLKNKFLSETNLSIEEIIDKVYRQPFANRFLASLAPHILAYSSNRDVYSLISNCFKEFFRKNVMQYDFLNNRISFIGSIAYHFKDILTDSATELNLKIDKIEKSPIDGLIKFHTII